MYHLCISECHICAAYVLTRLFPLHIHAKKVNRHWVEWSIERLIFLSFSFVKSVLSPWATLTWNYFFSFFAKGLTLYCLVQTMKGAYSFSHQRGEKETWQDEKQLLIKDFGKELDMRLGGQKRITPVVESQVYNVNLHDILKKGNYKCQMTYQTRLIWNKSLKSI